MTPRLEPGPGRQPVTEQAVRVELQQQPALFSRLAENALTVAESLRDNYFKNTAKFISHIRRAIRRDGARERLIEVGVVPALDWAALQGEVVTFIDGGVGSVQLSSQVPILLRVGSYCVKTGERNITEREQFGYYPIVLGDLEGGSRERKDFIDIVRITAELLGGLAALERTPDLHMLMFHGPLVYLVGSYAGHAPFTERDIDLFLRHYAPDPDLGQALKEGFLEEARVYTYPEMGLPRWADRRLFDPLAWMAFLYRRLTAIAAGRSPQTLIAGVVERGQLREFAETRLLPRVFQGLRENHRDDYFNEMYGRSDLTTPRNFLDRLGYTDALLLAMVLRPGEYSEAWEVGKYEGLRRGNVTEPGEGGQVVVDFAVLRPGTRVGFPRVSACYLQVTPNAEPVRVEVFSELGEHQIVDVVARAYQYARLLPGYGFPVGLDIADKFSKVPSWLTTAYGKLIKYHLGVSLQRGEITDAEMRRVLTQAIYMTHRDWLFRPSS